MPILIDQLLQQAILANTVGKDHSKARIHSFDYQLKRFSIELFLSILKIKRLSK